MQPSPYLDLDISMDQHRLFNPTKHENFIREAMEDVSGHKDVKNVTKKKINMDTGNVAIYSYLINGTHKLLYFQKANYLAATLGDMSI